MESALKSDYSNKTSETPNPVTSTIQLSDKAMEILKKKMLIVDYKEKISHCKKDIELYQTMSKWKFFDTHRFGKNSSIENAIAILEPRKHNIIMNESML